MYLAIVCVSIVADAAWEGTWRRGKVSAGEKRRGQEREGERQEVS